MINEALTFLAEELNEHFKTKFKFNEDIVVLSSLKNADGTSGVSGENKVVLTLINIEEDAVSRNAPVNKVDTRAFIAAPINIGLQILVSTVFSNNYPESLKYISEVIDFFHNKSVFTNQTSPKLDTGIEKLIVDLSSKTLEESTALWQMLGSTYTPSVVYKVRMLATG
ncbi:MAG: DUF4255 domain-containing protein [Bacteroidota bacterium]